MPDLVSFLIPLHNYARFLPDCLRSIASQTLVAPFEIVIVDDGSTDDVETALEGFDNLPINLIRHPKNKGLIASLHDGFAECQGQYIARVDPDDRYRVNFLSDTLPVLERHPEAGLVYGDVALMDGTGTVTQDTNNSRQQSSRLVSNRLVELLKEHFIASPSVLARRSAWEKAFPLPGQLIGSALDDWYLEVLMARESDFIYVPRIVADYRVHDRNLHSLSTIRRTDEPFVAWFLDRIFAETEKSPELEAAKQEARASIYAHQFRTLATKYFWAGMYGDARRCYRRAAWHRPSFLLEASFARQLFATLIGPSVYEFIKKLILRMGAKIPRSE